MQIQEVDTIQDLKLWVEENMQGAIVEEGEGEVIIRTNLISTMGGYLHLVGGECDKCGDSYELSNKDERCGDCGNCGDCCTHKAGEGE
jgi:hypothetical protein